MKKILAVLLAAAMLFALCACVDAPVMDIILKTRHRKTHRLTKMVAPRK